MSRIRIDLPSRLPFQTEIPIRVTDLNYGNHVGNDTVLTLIHEARVQYLANLGFQELDFAGVGLIMNDAGIEFRVELKYGSPITVFVGATNISKFTFDIFYRIEKEVDGKKVIAAIAKTGMVCFDYSRNKITAIPVAARAKLEG